jgi:hypothetical protein
MSATLAATESTIVAMVAVFNAGVPMSPIFSRL